MNESIVVPDQAKRTAILDAAIGVFALHGFSKTDVQVIANRAGVGKGTVYRYFGSKTDLFWAATLEVTIRLQKLLNQAAEGGETILEVFQKTARAYARFLVTHPDHLEIFIQQRAEFYDQVPETHRLQHELSHEKYVSLLKRGMESGEFRPDLDPDTTMMAFGGLIFGTLSHCCFHFTQAQREQAEIQEQIVDHVVRGANLFLDGIVRKEKSKE